MKQKVVTVVFILSQRSSNIDGFQQPPLGMKEHGFLVRSSSIGFCSFVALDFCFRVAEWGKESSFPVDSFIDRHTKTCDS